MRPIARKIFKQGGSVALTLPHHRGVGVGDIVLVESPDAGIFIVEKLYISPPPEEAEP